MKKPKTRKQTKKLGVEAHDPAIRPKNVDVNFKQSRDIHEDRGTIQSHQGKDQHDLRTRPS